MSYHILDSYHWYLNYSDEIFLFPGKIEMVKSKWGLAFSAVITVVASLLMSVSICTVFGLTPSLNGG